MHRIDSKARRDKLEPRKEPYWHRVRPGCHLGYRKPESGAGTWIAKRRDPDTGKRPQKPLGAILPSGKRDAFYAALAQATQWFDQIEAGVDPKGGVVAAICRDYVDELRGNGRAATADDAEGRFKRLIYGKPLGAVDLSDLKRTHLTRWFALQLPDDKTDPGRLRKAKDSANRNRTALLAALNLALVNGKLASDFAWKAFKPHAKVGARRERMLDRTERRRLLKACEADLRDLCEALLLTAARSGEVAAADVRDFDRKAGTLKLDGKTGPRVVELSSAAVALLTRVAHGRIGAAPLLQRANGTRWDRFAWRDALRDAVKDARLPAAVCAYTLRHTSISEMIAGGVDVLTVSLLSGTSVGMIQAHYGHLVRSGLRDKLDAVRLV